MNVLLISPFAKPNIGGVESHLEKLTNFLVKKGDFVYLLTYQPLTTQTKGEPIEKGDGREIYRASWFGYNFFPKLEPYFPLVFIYLFPGLFISSLNFYRKNHQKIDVIHAHGLTAALIAKILVKIYPKRSVVSTHAVYSFQNRKLLANLVKFVLRDFDAILAVGEPSRQELIQIGLSENKVKVHPNWINLEVFKSLGREGVKKELGLSGFVVLFVGRFLEKKGVGVLFEASKNFSNDIKFVFIGGGEHEDEIKKTSELRSNIIYAGKLFQDKPEDLKKLIQYYSAADVLVSPVLYDEGYSTVLLEAVACGTPIMISKRGCPEFFLNESVAVYLSPMPTSEEVSDSLKNLFSNKERLNNLQFNCRGYAEAEFSETNAEVILNSYFQK